MALGLLAAITVVRAMPDLVSACVILPDYPTLPTEFAGISVAARFGTDEAPLVMPRNAGHIPFGGPEPRVSFPYEPLDAMDGLFRASPPLEPGAEVDWQIVAGDEVVENAPTAPVVRDARVVVIGSDRGCDVFERDSCGGGRRVELQVELEELAVDDLAPPDRITDAVFSARTPEDAQTTRQPDGVRVLSPGLDGLVPAVFVRNRLHRRRDIWVTVMAIDQAGNTSPRT